MANPIIIKNNLKVGDLDAETDTSLLETCFIDKGYISQLMDVKDPLSIVLGRTGAGKSALIYKISQLAEKSKQIDPNDISVRFLEHSDIIQFLDTLDVNLDLFYRLLWRHILIVELLKLRYNIKMKMITAISLTALAITSVETRLRKKLLNTSENGVTSFG
ncbi:MULTISPECIES: hypothetical protein [Vibrio]|uniref:hypothetical protein n=1 Tax=Vibrio TaxID=662 RepID=UPI001C1073DB|nr:MULTISPECIES: hypothetical protein [Vibrio]